MQGEIQPTWGQIELNIGKLENLGIYSSNWENPESWNLEILWVFQMVGLMWGDKDNFTVIKSSWCEVRLMRGQIDVTWELWVI